MKFNDEEMSIILELARLSLSDKNVYDRFADELDLSDDVLQELKDKIEKAINPPSRSVLDPDLKRDFVTHNEKQDLSANGTSLQGEVEIDYDTLVKLFGEPTEWDGYVDAEWTIEFKDGTIATIYNYKSGKNYNGDDGEETENITNWHIGGEDIRAKELVEKVIKDYIERR